MCSVQSVQFAVYSVQSVQGSEGVVSDVEKCAVLKLFCVQKPSRRASGRSHGATMKKIN